MWPIWSSTREKVAGRAAEWGELQQTLAELAALDDFGFERNCAVGRREDQALADCDFAAGTNESAPAIFASGFGKHDFDAAGRFLDDPELTCAARRGARE